MPVIPTFSRNIHKLKSALDTKKVGGTTATLRSHKHQNLINQLINSLIRPLSFCLKSTYPLKNSKSISLTYQPQTLQKKPLLKHEIWDYRDGSVVRGTGFFQVSWVQFQDPIWQLTTVSTLTPFSSASNAHIWYTDTHAGKRPIHLKISPLNK